MSIAARSALADANQQQHAELARLRAREVALVAEVREWAAVNEIAAPPLDWAGLGAILHRPPGDASAGSQVEGNPGEAASTAAEGAVPGVRTPAEWPERQPTSPDHLPAPHPQGGTAVMVDPNECHCRGLGPHRYGQGCVTEDDSVELQRIVARLRAEDQGRAETLRAGIETLIHESDAWRVGVSTLKLRALLADTPAPTETGAPVKWPTEWDHCYEDMGSDPCGRPPVGARPDPEGGDLYPVCREHLRP